MNTIEKRRLSQKLANIGHNGCFTSLFLDNFCLIFVLKHSINYEINKIKNQQAYCMLEGFTKKKVQLGCKYIALGRDMFYLLNKNTF
jgi:hypothetical protein